MGKKRGNFAGMAKKAICFWTGMGVGRDDGERIDGIYVKEEDSHQ